jgi:hypothetical protein
MTHADMDRIMELCQRVCQEHDPSKFQKLVTELNELLAQKEQTLKQAPDPTS